VSVSLDAADPEIHEWVRGVKGCFAQAVAGIENLVRAGINTQVIMSIMRRNLDQIEPLVRLAEELGVGSVKFNLVNPTSRGETMHQRGETLTTRELVETGVWVENELALRSSISLFYSHPPAFRSLHRLCGKGDGGRCGILGILGVLGSGKYALCGIGETIPELIFGDAAKDRLVDVWNHNPVLKDIREGLPSRLSGICGDCLMKKICFGSCIAMNYSRHHDLFAPFWFCDDARRAGLFPESRLRPS
jgi:SynChlorMet cassette radical SAM/SPASM protein ScmF